MMFIKAYASGGAGQSGVQRRINNMTGVNRRENPMSRFYRQGGTTNLGGNSRTRNMGRSIQNVATLGR